MSVEQPDNTLLEPQNMAGDRVYGDQVGGDKVGGDKITVGDVGGSYNAIGAGAQVIVTQIQQALSAVGEMEKGIQAAERRLAAAIQQKISRYASLTAPTQVGAAQADLRENPYKALLDYKLEDAPFFYGRSRAVQAMRQKMGNGRLTILHSESGSGKTSLLQAGLASRLLADGHFPLYLRPYRQSPDQFIKKEFLPDYATLPELSRFRDEQMSLKGFLERVAYYVVGRQIYLFLDQFEEFFTEQPPETQRAFAEQLRQCVASDLPVRWVLSLRKEYFSDLRLFGALRPFDNEYFLPTFRLEEAQEVVTEPAALKGVQYEAGLVDHILSDLRQEDKGIPPAQVQLVCYTLFDELPTAEQAAVISHGLYGKPRGRGAGEPGAKGILTSHLTRVLDRELKGAERRIANRILEELVTSDVRRAVRSRAQLAGELETADSATLEHVLATLHENRLIRRDLDDNDQPRYELTHDYLLSEIELNPETQARKAAQELLAQELVAYRQFGTLLSKDRFDIIHSQVAFLKVDETAQTLLQDSETALEAERLRELEQERALAEAQRQRAEEAEQATAKQSRLTRIAFAVGGVALVLFIAAGIAGIMARNSAEEARTNEALAETRQSEAITSANLAAVREQEAEESAGLALTREAEANASAALAATRQAEAVASANLAATREAEATDLALNAQTQALMSLAISLLPANRNPTNVEVSRALLMMAQGLQQSETLANPVSSRLLDEQARRLLAAMREHPNQRIMSGHESTVWSVAFAPEGRWLASGSEDRTIRLWDLSDLDAEPRVLAGHEDWITSVAFDPEGRWLASGSSDETIRLWDLSDLDAEPRLLAGHENGVWSVAFAFEGHWLASGSYDGTIRLWDLSELDAEPRVLEGHMDGVSSVAFDPEGRWLASGGSDGTIRLWDLSDLDTAPRLLAGHEGSIPSVAFDPEGRWLASGGSDGTIRLWDLSDLDTEPRVLPGHEDWVRSVAFDSEGRWLASGGNDGTIRLWDLSDLEAAPRVLAGHEDWVLSVAFDSEGHWLASGSRDGTIRLWDLSELDAEPRVLTEHEGNAWSVAFAPEGRWLASGSEDRTIRLWDLSDLDAEPRVLAGHEDWVLSVAFDSEGRWLASGSADRTIRLWDLSDLEAAPRVLAGHEDRVWSVAFDPEGRWLASGSGDRTIQLWRTLEELAVFACERAGRNFSWDEWQQFLPGRPYQVTCPQWPVRPTVPEEFRPES